MAKRIKKVPHANRPQRGTLDSNGAEIVDSRPIDAALRLKREPSLAERIRAMIRSEQFAQEVESRGEETFEEADDFNIGDDYDPNSPYEEMFEGEFDYHAEERRKQKLARHKAVNTRNAPRGSAEDTRSSPSANSPGAGPLPADKAGPARTSNSPGEDPPLT